MAPGAHRVGRLRISLPPLCCYAVVVTPPLYSVKNIQFLPLLGEAKVRAMRTTRYGV